VILCFLRQLTRRAAESTPTSLRGATASGRRARSSEKAITVKFERVFARARALGLVAVAMPARRGRTEYVRQARDLLKSAKHRSRTVAHGGCRAKASLERERTAHRYARCRTSGVSRPRHASHTLRRMLEAGLVATVNSDDQPIPAG